MDKIKKVSIIGLGYVGLPTFVALHKTNKYEVVGYTPSQKRVSSLKKGDSLIDERYIDDYLKENNESITISNDPDILKQSDVFIVCVPTPIMDDYTPDYAPVISATELVGKYLKKGSHYVLESTVNPGTCEEVVIQILEKESGLKAGVDFNIAHCPERINPGDKKWNVYNINRNIGSLNQEMNNQIADFYRSFIPDAEIHEVSNLKVAEATKIVENTFRDINIAYVNELAQSFDAMNIDLIETLQSASNKPFAFMAHWPGCGVGGHCIAVDPYYLIRRASLAGFNHQFLKNAREVNNGMPQYTVNRLMLGLNEVGLAIKGTKIALLGLSYKPNIGDLRESPALIIEKKLQGLGADLVVYDPFIKNSFKDLATALKDVKAIVIATSHREFIEQLPGLLPKLSVKVIIDGRNCLPKDVVNTLPVIYKGIGR